MYKDYITLLVYRSLFCFAQQNCLSYAPIEFKTRASGYGATALPPRPTRPKSSKRCGHIHCSLSAHMSSSNN